MAKRVTKRAELKAGPRTDTGSSNSTASDAKGGECQHEAPDTFDATAASSSATDTTSLKRIREPSVFPAAGAPVTAGDSLNRRGQITPKDKVTRPGQMKPDDEATGVNGRVVGLEGAPGASAEGGVCGQAAAEHAEEIKEGDEAKGLSEEEYEVPVLNGFGAGPEAESSRVVVEWEVEDDGDSTAVGLKTKRVTDSTAPREAGTRSSRSDDTGTRQEVWHTLRLKLYRLKLSRSRNKWTSSKVLL